MKNILVCGYFNKGNAGDQLFIEAFHTLFPQYKFEFTNEITTENLSKCNAVFIGGGSFLYGTPRIKNCWDLLITKPIFYIGVGLETQINPLHQKLMTLAKLVAIRTPQYLDKALELNKNTILIPDLVYALQSSIIDSIKSKSVLIIPNFIVSPKWNDLHWKHTSWDYFKSELSQFMDELKDSGYHINILPMCSNLDGSDEWVGAEIFNKLINTKNITLMPRRDYNIQELGNIFGSHQFVITQRFHGIVLAEMANVPYISIFHHDKLKTAYPSRGKFLSYYGINKQILRDNFNSSNIDNFSKKLSIESNTFDTLVQSIKQVLGD